MKKLFLVFFLTPGTTLTWGYFWSSKPTILKVERVTAEKAQSLGKKLIVLLESLHNKGDRVTSQQISNIKKLISEGADINIKKQPNGSLLHFAVNTLNKEIVQLFLNQNINKNTQDGLGQTPLILAVHMGNPEIVEMILKKTSASNSDLQKLRKSEQKTSYLGTLPPELVTTASQYLNNADPTILDNNGQTALYYAKRRLSELENISRGASANVCAGFGPEIWNYPRIIQMLEQAIAKP